MPITEKEYGKRAERLRAAIGAAVKRLWAIEEAQDLISLVDGSSVITEKPFRIELISHVGKSLAKSEEGPWLQLTTELHTNAVDCYNIGSDPGDQYFELKLVPGLQQLALRCEYEGSVVLNSLNQPEESTKRELFTLVETQSIVREYKGNQLRSIITLLDRIGR